MFDKVNAVMYCRSKMGRNCNYSLLLRINIDHITTVSDCCINVFLRMYAPPKIAVRFSPESTAFDYARRKHFTKPFRRNDPLSVPYAVLQTKLTKLCHVSGA